MDDVRSVIKKIVIGGRLNYSIAARILSNIITLSKANLENTKETKKILVEKKVIIKPKTTAAIPHTKSVKRTSIAKNQTNSKTPSKKSLYKNINTPEKSFKQERNIMNAINDLYANISHRQQAHGGQINSTLDLRWNIISFSCQLLYSI